MQGTAIALKPLITRLIPQLNTSFLLRNTAKVVTGFVKLYAIFGLMKLYSKYDELKADDGIPNEKELLKTQAQDYENRWKKVKNDIAWIEKNITWSNIFKSKLLRKYTDDTSENIDKNYALSELLAMKTFGQNNFNKYPILSDAFIPHYRNGDHPSDLRRAMRFRKRIKQLESKQTKKARE